MPLSLHRPTICALIVVAVLTGATTAYPDTAAAIYGGELATDEGAVVPVTMFPNAGTIGACSGVLWKPRIVLTSAHCVVGEGISATYSTAQVRVGRPGAVRGDGDVFYPSAIVTPPDFVNRNYVTDQDFAALVFDRDIAWSDITRLATASEAESWAATGVALDVVGYGNASPVSSNPLVLRTSLVLTSAPLRSGHRWLELRATALQGACPGDSGGGVVIRAATGERLLAGIVAGGRSPCTRSLPPYTTVAAMPVGFVDVLDRALALAGYPALPSAPTSARAIALSGSRTVVSWSAPERNPEAVTSYVVASPDGTTLCATSADATSCTLDIPLDPAGGLAVRAIHPLGEIAESRVPITLAPVRRLDGGARQVLVSGDTYEIRMCVASGDSPRLEEQRGAEWVLIDAIPSAAPSPRCRPATPFLASFVWTAPSTGGRASRRVALRAAGIAGTPTVVRATVTART